ncbi:hypothetical protein GYMLUDRAFT_41967 [Collybiopsis luxurians FD-317 M1]|uniref:Uncharacterized protein n=1 Tax=Collybiopsis luxurians FD-317 M1 TaxID=944289 RepID=A0A0D0D0L2_9AGAR|nr:hypothetical protein GYMLUDRAFT_41967 [Collybiopsis luxurians FD-317 M1]
MPSHGSHGSHHSHSDVSHHSHGLARSSTSRSTALESLKTISDSFKSLPDVAQTLHELPRCIEQLEHIVTFSSEDVTKHVEIGEILDNLRADAKQFLNILRLSALEADQEYQFSIEMIELCDIIMSDSTGVHLQELVETMKTRATDMRESSTKVAEEFIKVNYALMETGKSIPVATETLMSRKQYVTERKRVAERRAAPLKVIRGGFAAAGGVVGVIGGISAIAFPPVALLALSAVLPILAVITNVIEKRNRNCIKERRAEERELKAAIKRLREASNGLNNLIDNLDVFTKFWRNIELILIEIGDRLAEFEYLRTSPSGKIRVEMMRNTWAEANEEYRKYRINLEKLRTLYSQSEDSRSLKSGRTNSTVGGTPNRHSSTKSPTSKSSSRGSRSQNHRKTSTSKSRSSTHGSRTSSHDPSNSSTSCRIHN